MFIVGVAGSRGFLGRMRTFDQRARELLNEVGLFNMFALPSVAPGTTNNNCDHQLLLSQYRGASSLTADLFLSGQCQHVVGLVNTGKIFHPAAVKNISRPASQSNKNCPEE